MKQNSLGVKLTTHEIAACGLPMSLTGPSNAASSVDYQGTFGVVRLEL
jgi:hypothetical protein